MFYNALCYDIRNMNDSMKQTNYGYLYLIATAVIWSTGGLLIKLVNANPVFIAFGRSFVAAILFLPFIPFKKIKWTKNLLILSGAYTICLITYVVATRLTTAANAIAIQYSSPLFLFLGLIFFKKQFDKTKLLPMAAILLGIIAFLLEPSTGSNVIGNLLALVSGLLFAVEIYYLGFDYDLPPVAMSGLLNLLLCPVAALFVPWRSSPWPTDWVSIAALIALGAFQIGFSYMLFYIGRRTVDALNTSIICLIEPVLNPILVFLFISEVPTVYALAGAALILVGQFLNIYAEKRKKRITA